MSKEEKAELEELYKYKIKEINKKYRSIYKDEEYITDNESYHIELDDLLIDLLFDIGYKEIVKMYNEAKEYFWYS